MSKAIQTLKNLTLPFNLQPAINFLEDVEDDFGDLDPWVYTNDEENNLSIDFRFGNSKLLIVYDLESPKGNYYLLDNFDGFYGEFDYQKISEALEEILYTYEQRNEEEVASIFQSKRF